MPQHAHAPPVRIAMWSGPRNISTALMRAWENRGDCAVSDEPLVSCDYNGNRASSTVDAELTKVIGDQIKVMSWYDNEMGYSQRMFDLARFVASKL